MVDAEAPTSRVEVELDAAAKREALVRKLEEIAEPVCRANGVELVSITYGREPGGAVVRVLLDTQTSSAPGSDSSGPPAGRASGVTLDDCTNVSRDLSTALDVNEPIDGAYRLEVSSPGLERPLVKLADFQRFAGREIRLKTRTPIGVASKAGTAERRSFQGSLLGVEGNDILLEQDGSKVTIAFDAVAKANLVHRFE